MSNDGATQTHTGKTQALLLIPGLLLEVNPPTPTEEFGQKHTEGHVNKDTNTVAMQPQVKECLEPPKAGRGKNGSSLKFSERMCLYRYLNFGLLTSRMVIK